LGKHPLWAGFPKQINHPEGFDRGEGKGTTEGKGEFSIKKKTRFSGGAVVS